MMSFYCEDCRRHSGEQFSYTRVYNCPLCGGTIQLINESGEANSPQPPSFQVAAPKKEEPAELFTLEELTKLHQVVNEKLDAMLYYASRNTQNIIEGKAAQLQAEKLLQLTSKLSAEKARVEALEKARFLNKNEAAA